MISNNDKIGAVQYTRLLQVHRAEIASIVFVRREIAQAQPSFKTLIKNPRIVLYYTVWLCAV